MRPRSADNGTQHPPALPQMRSRILRLSTFWRPLGGLFRLADCVGFTHKLISIQKVLVLKFQNAWEAWSILGISQGSVSAGFALWGKAPGIIYGKRPGSYRVGRDCPSRDQFCIKGILYPTPWIERAQADVFLLFPFPWLFENRHICYEALISDGKLVINQKLISVNLSAFLLL